MFERWSSLKCSKRLDFLEFFDMLNFPRRLVYKWPKYLYLLHRVRYNKLFSTKIFLSVLLFFDVIHTRIWKHCDGFIHTYLEYNLPKSWKIELHIYFCNSKICKIEQRYLSRSARLTRILYILSCLAWFRPIFRRQGMSKQSASRRLRIDINWNLKPTTP